MFDKSYSILDNILRSQKFPLVKIGMGYEDGQKFGEISKISKVNMENQGQTYVVLKNTKIYDELNSNKDKERVVGWCLGKDMCPLQIDVCKVGWIFLVFRVERWC